MPFNRMRYGRNQQRFRRPMGVIVSEKKQRNENITYLGGNANNNYTLLTGIATGVAETVSTAHVGKKLFSVDVSVNFVNGTANTGSTYNWMVWKAHAGQTTSNEFAANNASSWSVIGLSNARNQIIKSYMGNTGTEDAQALQRNVHIKIPKHMQRIRQGDEYILIFNATESGALSTGSRFKVYS